MENLHDQILIWLTVITLTVVAIGLNSLNNYLCLNYSDSDVLEKLWTILPIFILILIGAPRIKLLCLFDFSYSEPKVTVKITRNQ